MKKLWTCFIGCILLQHISCNKEDEHQIENLNNNSIAVLGHGGMGVLNNNFPMNSWEGIRKAISLGANGSEMDVQLTRDSILVAYHDKFLEEATTGKGMVSDRNWDELQAVLYKNPPYTRYKLCKLDDYFAAHGNNAYYTFDIKKYAQNETPERDAVFQRALVKLIKKYKLQNQVSIEIVDEPFLQSLQQLDSNLRLFYYTGTGFEHGLEVANKNKFKGITIDEQDISADQVKSAHDAGLWIAVFSTRATDHSATIRKNVDIIQTDVVSDLVRRLKKY